MSIAILIVAVALAAALVWNFHAPTRAWFKGKSTIIEAGLGWALYQAGILGEAYQEFIDLVDLPDSISSWLTPTIFGLWVIAKRVQTKTPVGKKL